MTENKRFTHKKWYNERQLFDGDQPFAIVDVYFQAEKICDKLNEQEETIQSLEGQLQTYDEGCHEIYKDKRKLEKENNRLVKMLDNLSNYMQKQNRDMPIDDFVEWWNNIATEGLDD